MVVVCTSIPLAIFTAIIALNLGNESINIMTLGGLALAIGMLVDDATVAVENIHRNLDMGKSLTVGVLDGSYQVAVPAIVATLSICIVFFPVILLYGPAKSLFTPLAFAVVTAMLASYLLSRTLVPLLSRMLLGGEHRGERPAEPGAGKIAGFFRRINIKREESFERFRQLYGRALAVVLHHRPFSLTVALLLGVLSLGLVLVIGTDFFPEVDVGMMKLHYRAPPGTRIEETEKLVMRVEERIREIIPPDELDTINDMIGVPIFYNLAFVQTENISGMDADLLISLKKGHRPTAHYRRLIRERLPAEFPGSRFYFQAADIVSQVLNFGLTSPVDVQIEGLDFDRSYGYAMKMRDIMRAIPGAEDVHINQVLDYPALQVNVDRTRAARLGMSERDVATSALISLSSSALLAPSFFLNPANNVNYTVAVQVPRQFQTDISNLTAMPITPPAAAALLQPPFQPAPADTPGVPAQPLANVVNVYHRASAENITPYTVQRVLDVEASVEGRDLGSVAADIEKGVSSLGKLPPGIHINVRGQNEVMTESFRSLALGLVLAIVLVYFLMVVLFQSWLDPLIIMTAVPGALVGILWMLALTGTTINVESLMGSIMAVGIATSNSILLVSFANDLRVEKNISPMEAALEAGKTRLRPVIMTALAMILGMLPMAFAMGEAGEQNAPLGRAVIGGLIVATLVTLFIVPVIYSILRTGVPVKHLLDERFAAEERGETANGRQQ